MKRTKTSVKYFEIIIGIIFIVVATLFGYFFMENGGMGIEESPYLSSANNNLESQDQNQTQFNDSENVLKVHFVDQTTPNMIQRKSGIFERKPLISKEI